MTESFSLNTRVPARLDGRRLDAVLAEFLPGTGMRAIRRLFESHDIRLNAKPAGKGQIARENDLLSVIPRCDGPNVEEAAEPLLSARDKDFLAFLKPAGMHCARIKGIPGPSLEAAIAAHARLFLKPENGERPARTREPGGCAKDKNEIVAPGLSRGKADILAEPCVRLLTRLDYETSGIVLAATSPEAETRFRELERAGRVEKYYLAVVRGAPDHALLIDNQLDTNKRVKTRVLPKADPDPTRHTEIRPVAALGDSGRTLVRARIGRGARHQIRAHLGFAGFPLVNDAVYGDKNATPGQGFMLHHYRLRMPEFTVTALPDWDDELRKLIEAGRDRL